MCGIFGILTNNKSTIKREELIRASSLLGHRGPDMHDVYVEQNIALSHYRLSVFDTSEKAKQPMHAFGYTIVFNGAIYNYLELKTELKAKGYSFSTNSDTELILAAYDAYKEKCVSLFNGQWAFAIYDSKRSKVFCSRDRFGIKPLYYFKTEDRFCFSSEIKAFTALENWKAKLNKTRAYEFLQFAMHDHTNESLFENVYQLERGTNFSIDIPSLDIDKNQYYSLDSIKEIEIPEVDAVKQVNTLLDKSISLRLRADVKSGTALSGGLDSSIIALRIAEKLEQEYNSYSIVYDKEEFNERVYVEAVLENTYLKGQVYSPGFDQFIENLDKLIWHQEEPFNSIAVYAQYYLFEQASKDNIKVMLDGQGADEIFAGYEKFYLPIFKKLIKRNPLKAIRLFGDASANFPHINAKDSAIRYLSKKTKSKSDCFSFDIDKESLFVRPKEESILGMSKNLLGNLGISALLRYEDRNAMAHGIESRVPYLDYELVEFALSLPDELKLKNGVTKWALRESTKYLLPKIIYSRRDKLGFATPESKWMLEHFDLIQSTIEKEREKLQSMVDLKLLFQENDMKKIFRVFIFSRWLSIFQIR